ncbi:MAG: hypothetical protein IIC73_07205 [Armatimonadetes bacterium]|nr:hypothetical protein [Armatimonadota bacterium]
MLAVGLVVGAGCSCGNAGAQSKSGPYDYDALDAYLADAKDPTVRASEPPSLGTTVGTKSLDWSSTAR